MAEHETVSDTGPYVLTGSGHPVTTMDELAGLAGLPVIPRIPQILTSEETRVHESLGITGDKPVTGNAGILLKPRGDIHKPSDTEILTLSRTEPESGDGTPPRITSGVIAQALHSPAVFLQSRFEKQFSDGDGEITRVIADVCSELTGDTQGTLHATDGVFRQKKGKQKKYYDRYSERKQTYTPLLPSPCEQAGMFICEVLDEYPIGPVFASKLLTSFSEILKRYRMRSLDEYVQYAPEMPELTEKITSWIAKLKESESHEFQGARFRAYEILDQLQISHGNSREILTQMDRFTGDYRSPLAYRLALNEYQNAAFGDVSPWLSEQLKRTARLRHSLRGSPQDVFERFGELQRNAEKIVIDPRLMEHEGKIGLELECLLKPVYASAGEFADGAVVAPGWEIGHDVRGNREIRSADTALAFGPVYAASFVPLARFMSDYTTHVAGFHANFDDSVHPYIADFGNLFQSTYDTVWNDNKDKQHRNELRGLYPIVAQRSAANVLDPAALANILTFFSDATRDEYTPHGATLTLTNSGMYTTDTLVWGHFLRTFDTADMRLSALLAMKHPLAMKSLRYDTLLKDFNESDKTIVRDVLMDDATFSSEKLFRLVRDTYPVDEIPHLLHTWLHSDRTVRIEKAFQLCSRILERSEFDTYHMAVVDALADSAHIVTLLQHKNPRVNLAVLKFLTKTRECSDALPAAMEYLASESAVLKKQAELLVKNRLNNPSHRDVRSLLALTSSDSVLLRELSVSHVSASFVYTNEELSAVVSLLHDAHGSVRMKAAEKLRENTELNTRQVRLLTALQSCIHSSRQTVRDMVFTAAQKLAWTPELIEMARNRFQKPTVPLSLIRHFEHETDIPDDILRHIIRYGIFHDETQFVCQRVMDSRHEISNDTVTFLLSFSKSEDSDIRMRAALMMEWVYKDKPYDIHGDTIVSLIDSETSWPVGAAYIRALRHCPRLPVRVLEKMIPHLDSSLYRDEIVLLFDSQLEIPQRIIKQLISYAHHEQTDTRIAALRALTYLDSRVRLQMDTSDISRLLDVAESTVPILKYRVSAFFRDKSSLLHVHESVQKRVLGYLSQENAQLRSIAIDMLSWSDVSENIWRDIETLYDTRYEDAVRAIYEICTNKPSIPEFVLKKIVRSTYSDVPAVGNRAFEFLKRYPHALTEDSMHMLWQNVFRTEPEAVYNTMDYLHTHASDIPDSIIPLMIRTLPQLEANMLELTTDTLSKRSVFTTQQYLAFAELLESTHTVVVSRILKILSGHENFPEQLVRAVLGKLKSHSQNRDESILKILENQALTLAHWKTIETYFDETPEVSDYITDTFRHHTAVPVGLKKKFETILENRWQRKLSELRKSYAVLEADTPEKMDKLLYVRRFAHAISSRVSSKINDTNLKKITYTLSDD